VPWALPHWWPFIVSYVLLAGVTGWITSSKAGFLGWELTIAWSWPVINSIIGLCGVWRSRQLLRAFWAAPSPVRQHDPLIVTVPTIGRRDVLPALRRSLASHAASFPVWFSNFRIDVVVDEGCEAAAEIHGLAAPYEGLVRVITVAAAYRTPNGTRFKARSEHYANELHQRKGEARPDVWVLHMDDDTGTSPGTARAIASFIQRQGREGCHLAQGVLTYPRQFAPNWFTWLADSVRPADDLSRFCAWTGGGTPRAGLHGELLLVRASVEAEIGWDFGPEAIVEDAWFAMTFAQRHPGRSAWLPGRCFGASPATVPDFIRQRERWARGLMHLCFSPRFPAGSRLYLAYSLTTWIPGPLQNIVTVLILQALVLSVDGSPVAWPVIFIWSVNMAYYIWCYLEGHRVNAMASDRRTPWWNYVLVLLLLPVFSVVEGLASLIALFRFSSGHAPDFSVIAKPS
jgi:beta-1,4-mannosyltransferase